MSLRSSSSVRSIRLIIRLRIRKLSADFGQEKEGQKGQEVQKEQEDRKERKEKEGAHQH